MDDQEIMALGRKVADKDLEVAVNTENVEMKLYYTILSVKVGARVMAHFVRVIYMSVRQILQCGSIIGANHVHQILMVEMASVV